MAVSGLIAVGVSIWAVCLLRQTLVATRLAIREASRTTKAARDAADSARKQADIAEQSMRRFERPYLFLKITQTRYISNPGGNRPFIDFVFVNHGRTPAIIESLSYMLQDNPELPLRIPMHVNRTLYRVIDPGQRADGFRAEIEGASVGQAWADETATRLTFYGVIRYTDPVGNKYTDGFCVRGELNANTFVRQGGSEYNYSHIERADEPQKFHTEEAPSASL